MRVPLKGYVNQQWEKAKTHQCLTVSGQHQYGIILGSIIGLHGSLSFHFFPSYMKFACQSFIFINIHNFYAPTLRYGGMHF